MSPKSGRDGAINLSPLQKPQEKLWYSRQAVGHNTLQKMIPDFAKDAGMNGHYTKHSLRSTAATALYRGGVDEHDHGSDWSPFSIRRVRSYKRKSEEQMKTVSETLSSVSVKKPKTFVQQTGSKDDQCSSQNSKFTFVNFTFTM